MGKKTNWKLPLIIGAGVIAVIMKVMNPDKVFLGMPAYGWNWRIHDTPKNMGVTYRGTSNTGVIIDAFQPGTRGHRSRCAARPCHAVRTLGGLYCNDCLG